MKREPFEILSRDLFVRIKCVCADKQYADNPILAASFKTQRRFTGYDDDNFFDNVNRTPQIDTCANCGQRTWFQWKRDGFLYEHEYVPGEVEP